MASAVALRAFPPVARLGNWAGDWFPLNDGRGDLVEAEMLYDGNENLLLIRLSHNSQISFLFHLCAHIS